MAAKKTEDTAAEAEAAQETQIVPPVTDEELQGEAEDRDEARQQMMRAWPTWDWETR